MDNEAIKRNDIDIYYRETPDYAVVNTHFHNVCQIIYVADGMVRIDIDNKTYTVSKNAIVFISNLERHSVNILKSPYKRYVISLTQDFSHMMLKDSALLSILVQRPENFSHVIGLSDGNAENMLEILNAMLRESSQKKAFWNLRLSSLVIELLIRLYRISSAFFPVNDTNNAVKIVTEIQKYIIQNGHNGISLEMMAAQHFVSKYYLTRIFKKITGYTFKDYLILHRLSIAKDLLIHTDKSVTEVCYYSGYNNINHFIRIFKAYEGITPYQYKKAYIPH